MVEVYVAIAVLSAAVYAAFMGAVLVYIQVTASELSSRLPRLLLRDWRFYALSGPLLGLAVAALVGAVRAAFPEHDFLGAVDFRSDEVFLESGWAAAGMAVALLICGGLSGYLVYRYAAFLGGARVVEWVLAQVDFDEWRRYGEYALGTASPWVQLVLRHGTGEQGPLEVEFRDLGEQQRRYTEALDADIRSGRLRDPMSVVVDVLGRAARNHEFETFSSGLEAWKQKITQWVKSRRVYEGDGAGRWEPRVGEAVRCAELLSRYLQSLAETVIAVGHPSLVEPIVSMVQHVGEVLVEFEGYRNAASKVVETLGKMGRGYVRSEDDMNLQAVIRALGRLGVKSAEVGSEEVFDDAARLLGWIGELIAARELPERTLIRTNIPVPEDSPMDTLVNTMWRLGERICPRLERGKEPGILFDALIFKDANYVVITRLLSVKPLSPRVEEYAVSLAENIGAIAELGAETTDDRSVWIACSDLETLYKEAQQVGADKLAEIIAVDLFHTGLIAAGNNEKVAAADVPLPDVGDRIDLVIRHMSGVEPKHMVAAMEVLYMRGHTTRIPPDAQKEFVKRLSASLNCDLMELYRRSR